ncbi:Signal transduction histidine kinase [endosymbiont of Ridgeia piscesae]|uniref:histidine kinase n=2 Tax=endosymbiont of Ridgeia piscesae TaxID=54398 RepID=A0A0T5YZU7_9GAMM|nr:ATP-binding protein [endosymbiont of Ridgeia piscesae]KRT56153.1 Signal transduction histidine kinase [endosymbiont of Ridgeia piscesae]
MKLRTQLLLFLFLYGFIPLIAMVAINLPFVLDRMELFYHKAHLQNLRADFKDLDEHLASRHVILRLLAKLPEPGTILERQPEKSSAEIDAARLRYTGWINETLRGQLDIVQILFIDNQGRPRFWLERDSRDQQWKPTVKKPELPSKALFQASIRREFGFVGVSQIRLNQRTNDPRRLMTLTLISPVFERAKPGGPIGAVAISIDVGGMAQAYRDTLWVTNNGAYFEERLKGDTRPLAFADFQGLEEIFRQGSLALWKGDKQQVIWVPLFMTEESGPLWVGRSVDPSPLAEFRTSLSLRVILIVLVALIIVLLSSRWIAQQIAHFSETLADGIGRVLKSDQPVAFHWRGPREIEELGEKLTALAETHAHHTQAQREHARQLEESNRYKSEFLANVSHELRTPLNSILLLSKMLREEGDNLGEQQCKQLKVIHEAGSDLKALIDNILDLSRIEAGQAGLVLDQIDIRRMVEELLELVQPQFEAKELYLKAEFDPQLPDGFLSDQEKVRQILKNFLSNSVKFTAEGGAILHVYRDLDSACCPLCFALQDSGIGIPQEKHELIFEAFKQADGSTNRRFGGTGLGLSISRQLAQLLGGEIRLQSQEQQGARFTLCLPLQPPADAAIEPPPEQPSLLTVSRPRSQPEEPPVDAFTGGRLLLVDNNLNNLLALTPLLEGWGLEVTAAGDGDEVLETLNEESDFAITLVDTMMLGMDGYDTIRRIREEARFNAMAIIALTADTTAEDRERCLEVGADDFISKPIEMEELKTVIERHLPA